MFEALRVEEQDGEGINPETQGPDDSSDGNIASATPKKPRKHKRKGHSSKSPWTEADYRAYREERRKPPTPDPVNPDAYFFLFEALSFNLECLHHGYNPVNQDNLETTSIPEENKTSGETPTSDTKCMDTLPARTPKRFEGEPAQRTSLSEAEIADQEYLRTWMCKDESDLAPKIRWTWKPGGDNLNAIDSRGPTPLLAFHMAAITARPRSPNVGTEGGGIKENEPLFDVHSWKDKTTVEKVARPIYDLLRFI